MREIVVVGHRAVWAQAVVAEVYALNLALVSFTVRNFLRWRSTGRERHLLLACGLYAISFGNYLTVVCLLPAVVMLVLWHEPAVMIRPRVVAPVALT